MLDSCLHALLPVTLRSVCKEKDRNDRSQCGDEEKDRNRSQCGGKEISHKFALSSYEILTDNFFKEDVRLHWDCDISMDEIGCIDSLKIAFPFAGQPYNLKGEKGTVNSRLEKGVCFGKKLDKRTGWLQPESGSSTLVGTRTVNLLLRKTPSDTPSDVKDPGVYIWLTWRVETTQIESRVGTPKVQVESQEVVTLLSMEDDIVPSKTPQADSENVFKEFDVDHMMGSELDSDHMVATLESKISSPKSELGVREEDVDMKDSNEGVKTESGNRFTPEKPIKNMCTPVPSGEDTVPDDVDTDPCTPVPSGGGTEKQITNIMDLCTPIPGGGTNQVEQTGDVEMKEDQTYRLVQITLLLRNEPLITPKIEPILKLLKSMKSAKSEEDEEIETIVELKDIISAKLDHNTKPELILETPVRTTIKPNKDLGLTRERLSDIISKKVSSTGMNGRISSPTYNTTAVPPSSSTASLLLANSKGAGRGVYDYTSKASLQVALNSLENSNATGDALLTASLNGAPVSPVIIKENETGLAKIITVNAAPLSKKKDIYTPVPVIHERQCHLDEMPLPKKGMFLKGKWGKEVCGKGLYGKGMCGKDGKDASGKEGWKGSKEGKDNGDEKESKDGKDKGGKDKGAKAKGKGKADQRGEYKGENKGDQKGSKRGKVAEKSGKVISLEAKDGKKLDTPDKDVASQSTKNLDTSDDADAAAGTSAAGHYSNIIASSTAQQTAGTYNVPPAAHTAGAAGYGDRVYGGSLTDSHVAPTYVAGQISGHHTAENLAEHSSAHHTSIHAAAHAAASQVAATSQSAAASLTHSGNGNPAGSGADTALSELGEYAHTSTAGAAAAAEQLYYDYSAGEDEYYRYLLPSSFSPYWPYEDPYSYYETSEESMIQV